MKRQFVRFDVRLLRNEEWFNFHVETKGYILRFTAEWLKIEELAPKFANLLQMADNILEVIRKSALTKEIQRLDAVRKKSFRALKAGWKVGMLDTNPAKHAAGERLLIMFQHFGNLPAKSYNEVTGGIVNMVEDLRGKYAADVELLNLAEVTDRLDADNNAFEAAIMKRNEEAAERPDDKLIKVRYDLDRCYLDILERIEALALIEGVEHYEGFIRVMNANIERYKR